MYGRLEPKPAAPAYTAEERAAMRRADEAGKAAARAALAGGGGPGYAALELPRELGLDCGRYKWRQSQSHVEVFVPLPPGLPRSRVRVTLTTTRLAIEVDEAPVLAGQLYRAVKAGESTWYCVDGVLEVVLAKRCRRGAYEAGATNAGEGRGAGWVRGWRWLAVAGFRAGSGCVPVGWLERPRWTGNAGACRQRSSLTPTPAAAPPHGPATRRHVLAGGGAGRGAHRAPAAGGPAAAHLLLLGPLRGPGEGGTPPAAPGQRARRAGGGAGGGGGAGADRGVAGRMRMRGIAQLWLHDVLWGAGFVWLHCVLHKSSRN